MSDDIVTRLRGELVVRVNGEPWVTFDALPVLGEAADEIERLRAEVARLSTFLHPIGIITHEAVRVIDDLKRDAMGEENF